MQELKIRATEVLEEDRSVTFAYLFGSMGRQQVTPLSDVDIAVYLDHLADPVEHKLNLLGKLMERLGTDDIDLVVLNSASLPLKARVVRDGQILVDRHPYSRHLFEVLVLREFFDFAIFEGVILRRRFLLG